MKQMKRITLRLSLENPSDKKIADFLANIDKNKYHTVNNAIKTISGYHFESASELTSLLYLQTGAAKAAIIRR